MSSIAHRAAISLPRPRVDQVEVGLGVLVGAILVAAPALAGPIRLPASAQFLAIPLEPLVLLGAALLALVGSAELLGRSELRQGGTILAFALAAVAIALLAVSLRDGLANGGAELATTLPLAAAGAIVAWGAGLAFGSMSFGPTRAAVLVGISTVAVVLLLPVGPKPEPFLAFALDSGWSYSLVPLLAATLAALWRLLDLPRLGGIALGGGLLVFAAFWYATVPEAPAPCPAGASDCLHPEGVQLALWAGCTWIGLGALLGRPDAS